MSRKTVEFALILLVGATLSGLVGCGGGEAPAPPESDAVTTDPLNIEIPDASSDAETTESAEGDATGATDEVPPAPEESSEEAKPAETP